MKIKNKPFKHCPRCDNKCIQTAEKCDDCGLIFSRLDFATNKAAKELMKKGERDYIIYTTQLPKDLSYTKLLLYTLLLGLVGAQYYYTGKYIKGFLMTTCFAIATIGVIFNSFLLNVIELIYIPCGIAVIAWIVSCVYVISRKFKVPICLERMETGGFKV